MRYRGAVAAGFLAITAAFAVGIPHVEIRTIFNDLLPRDDPFVQVFFDHRNFGNPLTMSIMELKGSMRSSRSLLFCCSRMSWTS